MSNLLKEIEEKLENAAKQFSENNSLLNQKIQQIEQLTAEKSTITALLHQLNGWIAAYQDLKKWLLSGSVEGVAEVIQEIEASKTEGN